MIIAVITTSSHILTQLIARYPHTQIQTRFLLCMPWRKMEK